MKLYTRKGDEGKTFCIKYLEYVSKNHPFMEFMGTLDEAESALGLASSLIKEDNEYKRDIDWIQELLFRIGFTIADKTCITQEDIEKLEKITDKYSERIQPRFSLNGGHPASAAVSLARAIVRRTERRLVDLVERKELINQQKLVQALLNRASDALYAIQIALNTDYGYKNKEIKCP